MREADNETRVTYGLRIRKTGEMLRIKQGVETYSDGDRSYSETTYSLGTDPDCPLFAAASEEDLALVFASGHPGGDRITPDPGHYRPADLEPVVVEETITRRIRASNLAFEVPVRVDGRNAFDIHPELARDIEGLGPVIEAFGACSEDLARVPYPGADHGWGRCRLSGKAVAGGPEELPDGCVGSIVMDIPGHGHSEPRRAITALPLPASAMHLLDRRGSGQAKAGTLLVCLNDRRKLPDSLVQALADLTGGPGLKP